MTYPNMAMEVEIVASEPPVASFHADTVGASGNGELRVSVVANNGSLIPVFTLDLNLGTSATVQKLPLHCHNI